MQAPKGSSFKVGDRVAALLPLSGAKWGSCQEVCSVREDHLAKIPDSVSFEEAAALPLVGLTCLRAFSKIQAPLRGKKILIHAGAGGLGSFAIQWAKNVLGMFVATTCSERNIERVKEIGAVSVLSIYTQPPFAPSKFARSAGCRRELQGRGFPRKDRRL